LPAELEQATSQNRRGALPTWPVGVVLNLDCVPAQDIVNVDVAVEALGPELEEPAQPQVQLIRPVTVQRAWGNQVDRLRRVGTSRQVPAERRQDLGAGHRLGTQNQRSRHTLEGGARLKAQRQ